MIQCCHETISLPWRTGDLYLLHPCPDAYSGSLPARLSLSRRSDTPKLSSRDLYFRFDFDRPDRSRGGPSCRDVPKGDHLFRDRPLRQKRFPARTAHRSICGKSQIRRYRRPGMSKNKATRSRICFLCSAHPVDPL